MKFQKISIILFDQILCYYLWAQNYDVCHLRRHISTYLRDYLLTTKFFYTCTLIYHQICIQNKKLPVIIKKVLKLFDN